MRPMTHCEHVIAMTRKILNKFTPMNESVLKQDFLRIEFWDQDEVQGVVHALFERAAVEQRCISTYARFCTRMNPTALQACLKPLSEAVFEMEGSNGWLKKTRLIRGLSGMRQLRNALWRLSWGA